ncbi:MAG: DUF1922 domain-containing protein [Thermocladium sp.]
MEYLVLICPRCGRPSAARTGSRSHECPYCGFMFPVANASLVGKASSGREAREIIRQLLDSGKSDSGKGVPN